LALEVCVYNTAKDAKEYFDDVTVILDACGSLSPESAQKTEQDLMDLDIEIGYSTEEVLND
jgi:nicotinamidase-related amidase